MELSFHGANCLTISVKQTRFVVDDNLDDLGARTVTKSGDVALFTLAPHPSPATEVKLIIDGPGEYEIENVAIQGIAARAHIDEPGQMNTTIYKIVTDEIRLLVLGHLYPQLSEVQLERIGAIDVLTVPVGNHGYTLDATGALSLIKKIEPKLVIPTHCADEDLKFEVPQQTLEEALKGLAMEPRATLPKLRPKPADLIEDTTQLIVLEKS